MYDERLAMPEPEYPKVTSDRRSTAIEDFRTANDRLHALLSQLEEKLIPVTRNDRPTAAQLETVPGEPPSEIDHHVSVVYSACHRVQSMLDRLAI